MSVLKHRYTISIVIRLVIVFVTDYLEANNLLNCSDIDYSVYSDGAKHVINGESPYLRETYRYSPMMAYLMTINIIVHRTAGKVIFCLADVISGLVIELILFSQDKVNLINDKRAKFTFGKVFEIINSNKYALPSLFQLFNPLSIAICTRGSSDSLTIVCNLLVILFVECEHMVLAGVIFGFIIHFRIYPIIYSLALFIYILQREVTFKLKHREVILEESDTESKIVGEKHSFIDVLSNIRKLALSLTGIKNVLKLTLKNFIFLLTNKNHWIFTFTTIAVFALFNLIFYHLYGDEYLYEALLYHFVRKDHRHNFSIYNYMIYLTYSQEISKLVSLSAFIPQVLLIFIFSIVFSTRNINFCLILITMTFVHFNKVVTAQYFLWYFSLFPLIVNSNNLFRKSKGLVLVVCWLFVELIWNYFAHELEYNGKNVFLEMFCVDVIFFLISVLGIKEIIKEQNYNSAI